MASRLVLMPVLPRVTVSEAENFDDEGWVARAASKSLELSQAAPRPDAERMRNSRRCIKSPASRNCSMIRVSAVIRTAFETLPAVVAFPPLLFSVPSLRFRGWRCGRHPPKDWLAAE